MAVVGCLGFQDMLESGGCGEAGEFVEADQSGACFPEGIGEERVAFGEGFSLQFGFGGAIQDGFANSRVECKEFEQSDASFAAGEGAGGASGRGA